MHEATVGIVEFHKVVGNFLKGFHEVLLVVVLCAVGIFLHINNFEDLCMKL